jgi:hypothetical protein
MSENGNDELAPRGEGEVPSGQDELLYSIAALLTAKQTKESIARLIERYAEEIPKRGKAQRHALYIGHAITVVVLVTIGLVGYLKVLSSETCGALFGAVVSGIYFSNRR